MSRRPKQCLIASTGGDVVDPLYRRLQDLPAELHALPDKSGIGAHTAAAKEEILGPKRQCYLCEEELTVPGYCNVS
jgi:hypothetical protein